MTWPNDELRRDSFVATYLARFIEMSGQSSPEDQPAAQSADDCVGEYLRRLPDDETPWPNVSNV
jgi:hypothetical protein